MHCLLNALYDDAEMIEDSDKRCLKKKIYVQLDNCSRENKNKYLLALLALLVKWKKTEEVKFQTDNCTIKCFLPLF